MEFGTCYTQGHYTAFSLTLNPHREVILIPVVGLAILENGKRFSSMSSISCFSCSIVPSRNIPKTSSFERLGCVDSSLKIKQETIVSNFTQLSTALPTLKNFGKILIKSHFKTVFLFYFCNSLSLYSGNVF